MNCPICQLKLKSYEPEYTPYKVDAMMCAANDTPHFIIWYVEKEIFYLCTKFLIDENEFFTLKNFKDKKFDYLEIFGDINGKIINTKSIEVKNYSVKYLAGLVLKYKKLKLLS